MPFEIVSHICDYLKISEYLALTATCTNLRSSYHPRDKLIRMYAKKGPSLYSELTSDSSEVNESDLKYIMDFIADRNTARRITLEFCKSVILVPSDTKGACQRGDKELLVYLPSMKNYSHEEIVIFVLYIGHLASYDNLSKEDQELNIYLECFYELYITKENFFARILFKIRSVLYTDCIMFFSQKICNLYLYLNSIWRFMCPSQYPLV